MRQLLQKFLPDQTEMAIQEHLSKDESHYLRTAWLFGNSKHMQAAGPEFAFLPCLRWQCEGVRQMVLAPFKAIVDYLEPSPASKQHSFQEVVDFLSEVLAVSACNDNRSEILAIEESLLKDLTYMQNDSQEIHVNNGSPQLVSWASKTPVCSVCSKNPCISCA